MQYYKQSNINEHLFAIYLLEIETQTILRQQTEAI